MKYIDEFQDPELARRLLDDIHSTVTRPWALMEVCGGQTHTIIRHGIDQLLPDQVELIHGPGCPVCVTPLEVIDKALEIASRPEVIFCSFGDMLRVPGTGRDLFQVRSEGGDVRINLNQDDGAKGWDRIKGLGFALTIWTTEDIDAIANRIKASGGRFDHEAPRVCKFLLF